MENTYNKLKNNPKQQYEKKLQTFVKEGRDIGILNKIKARYLIPESTRTPVIYYLPKIHKRTEKPTGRSIISGIDSLFFQTRRIP